MSESQQHEESGDDLLKLIENKSQSIFSSPTAELIKSVTENKKTNRPVGDVDIQSMMYSS